MEALAIISHLLIYVLAMLAVYLCVTLFRQRRAFGWLLIGMVFLEPFFWLVIRGLRGRPLLAYKAVSVGSDGIMHVNYRFDFPFFYILAVAGLLLLVREFQKKAENKDETVA